jgi:single-stranded DNA-binding protein
MVSGKMRQETYTNKEGEQRTVWKLIADDVAPSLKFTQASVAVSNGRATASKPDADNPPF